MKTKSIVFLLAMALLSLNSCQKREPLTINEPEGDYLLEIEGIDGTRAASSVELNLANLTNVSSRNVSAQLKRRSGSSWVSVNDGVIYSWNASSADSKKFSGSGTQNKSCTISAIAEGNGTMNVSASLSGVTVATTGVPVTVSDSRALTWSNVAASIESGSIHTATLTSNFSCTSTVTSDNGSFLVGTSAGSLSSSASVTFTSNKTVTIYYRYDGTQSSHVDLSATSGNISSTADISVEAPVTLKEVKLEFPGLNYNKSKGYYEASYSMEGPGMNEDMPTFVSDMIEYHLLLIYSDGTEEEAEPGSGNMSLSGYQEIIDSDFEEGWFQVQLTYEKDDLNCTFTSYTYGVTLYATIHWVY